MTDTTPDSAPAEDALRRQAEAVERIIAHDPGAFMPDAGADNQDRQRRQLAAVRGIAGLELGGGAAAADERRPPTDHADSPGSGPDATADAQAPGGKWYVAVEKGTLFVDVPVPPWKLPIPQWNTTRQAPGWELTGANLQMPGGRPHGYFVYHRTADHRMQRVGIRWDVDHELPDTACLHESKGEPLGDRRSIDADALELDALARATALMSINAFIGANVVTLDGENTILEAAGLGIPRIDLAEKRQTRR